LPGLCRQVVVMFATHSSRARETRNTW
jgi:hypothetical protein